MELIQAIRRRPRQATRLAIRTLATMVATAVAPLAVRMHVARLDYLHRDNLLDTMYFIHSRFLVSITRPSLSNVSSCVIDGLFES